MKRFTDADFIPKRMKKKDTDLKVSPPETISLHRLIMMIILLMVLAFLLVGLL